MRTQVKSTRHWHYGADAKPITYPWFGFAVRSHVFFSDNGDALWDNPDRMHAARASQCKNWWNAAWRDRMLGTMSWLSGGAEFLQLPVSATRSIGLRSTPVTFASPVSYGDPGAAGWSDDDEQREGDETETDEAPGQ
jgi:hypothetical protein